jgi:hypothetical protein
MIRVIVTPIPISLPLLGFHFVEGAIRFVLFFQISTVRRIFVRVPIMIVLVLFVVVTMVLVMVLVLRGLRERASSYNSGRSDKCRSQK